MQTGFEKLGNIKTTGFTSAAANVGAAAKKMAEQVKEAANKTKAAMTTTTTDASGKQQIAGIKEVVSAYKEMYDLMTKIVNAKGSATAQKEGWNNRLQGVITNIEDYRKENAAMVEVAASYDKVVNARHRYEDAVAKKIDTTNDAAALQQQKLATEAFTRQQQQAIAALQQWQNLNRQMTGMDRSSQNFQELSRQAEAARGKFLSFSDAVRTSQKVVDEYNKQVTKTQGNAGITTSTAKQEAYNNALRENLRVSKEIISLEGKKSSSGSAEVQARIASLKQQQANAQAQITSLEGQGVSNEKLKAQCEDEIAAAKARQSAQQAAVNQAETQALNRLMSMVKMYVVMRGLRALWRNAITYAQEYYDKLNEIQIVTQKSDTQMQNISNTFKNMAKGLKISSTDIATAATTFYRQGLDEEETKSRTKWASMYAKITAQSFDEAATQVTASVNSMGISAQEVVDVFTYLGDNSASSGAEIGEAMQKAAAAAAEFGLDFRTLGAYIATVSETTRQEASTIGTAFNSIFARWHNIKKTGYDVDDNGNVTGTNDIERALSNIGMSLFDTNNEWRDMGVVIDELAGKWNGLDAITKSYIATTIAGTKQQNVFLALMRDMSKGVENGSRMYELYNGTLTASGTVTSKYETYLRSVTAAQEGMNVSLERLYASIVNSDDLKNFYNIMSGLADAAASGMEAFGGVALRIIAITAAVASLVFVISQIVTLVKDIKKALMAEQAISAVLGVLSGGKLMLAVTAIAAVVAGVVTLVGAIRNATDESAKLQKRMEEISQEKSDIKTDYASLKSLRDEYSELASTTNRTKEQQDRLEAIWKQLKSFSPTLALALAQVSGGYENQTGVVTALNGELERLLGNYQKLSQEEAKQKAKEIASDFQSGYDKASAYRNLAKNYGIDSLSLIFGNDDFRDMMNKQEKSGWIYDELIREGAEYARGYAEILIKAMLPENDDIDADALAKDIANAWITAMQSAGKSISFDDFIIDFLQPTGNGDALQQYVTTYVDQFKDLLFTALASPDYYAGDAVSQNVYRELFDMQFESLMDAYEGETLADKIATMFLTGGETAVSTLMVKMSTAVMNTIEGMKMQSWYKSWDSAVRSVIKSYNPDDTTAFDENYHILESVFPLYQEQYGASFTVFIKSMPTKDSLIKQAKGMETLSESYGEAGDEAESLAGKIKDAIDKQVEANKLAELKSNGFKSWIDELNGIFDDEKFANDPMAMGNDIISWLSEDKTEDEMKAFIGIYTEFADDFAAINAAIAGGNAEDVEAAIQQLQDHVTQSADSIAQAAKNYKKAEETLTDAQGKALVLDYASKQFDEDNSIANFFDDLNAKQIAWLTKNSEAFQKFLAARKAYDEAVTDEERDAALGGMIDAVASLQGEADGYNLSNIVEQIDNIGTSADESAKSISKAYSAIFENSDAWYKAQAEYEAVQKKMADGGSVTYDDASNIASYLGMSPQAVLTDWENVPTRIAAIVSATQSKLEALNAAAFKAITGATDETFKNIRDGAVIVDGMSDDMLNLLTMFGMFKVESKEVNGDVTAWNAESGTFGNATVSGTHNVLTLTGYTPYTAANRTTKEQSKYSEILADAQKTQELQALSESKYSEWISGIMDTLSAEGKTDAEKAKALYEYLSQMDTDQFKAFINMYPKLAEAFSTIFEEGNKGEEADWGKAGEENSGIIGYLTTVTAKANAAVEALEKYKEANKSTTDEEGNTLLEELANGASENNPLGLMDTIGTKSEKQVTWLVENSEAIRDYTEAYDKYQKALENKNIKEAEYAMRDMRKAIRGLNGEAKAVSLKNLQTQISNLGKSADKNISAVMDAYDDLNDFADSYLDAADEFAEAQAAYDAGMELTTDSVQKIASLLNMTPQAVLANWNQIPSMMQDVVNDGLAALDELNANSFFTITGTSYADFSNITNGIAVVEGMADDMLEALLRTGHWTVETVDLDQRMGYWDAKSQSWSEKYFKGQAQVLKPSGSNPFSGSGRKSSGGSGGGGGGGGGGSSGSEGKTEEELFVERTNEALQRISDTMSQLSTITDRYDSQGYYTAEADALEKMNTLLEEQSDILRKKIDEAKARLPGLYEELKNATPDTEAYEKIQGRIEDIQDAVVDWTQKLEENTSSVISNKQKIEDLHDSIRDLEIDLENEILEAIENREEKQQTMLKARISMEETILDILKEQAEKAEKEITDSIDKQIDALNKEKDAVSEILNKRKEQADQEDKLKELQELQAKYARISADPTRAKEAKSILDDIRDLQKEIAWSQTENEAEEQQKSIDQQIESLEDYKEEVEKYYEDLLENPRNFIEQVESVMKMSREEILKWLEENSEDYKNSLDDSREDMRQGWEDTLDEMNGIVESHWDEVQEIIKGGDEAIIKFLKENASKYEEASKLQQESYLKGWRETLDNIKKAHEKMENDLLDTKDFASTVTTGKTDGDTKKETSGGGGGNKTTTKPKATTGYKIYGTHPRLGYQEITFEASKYGGMSGAYVKAQAIYNAEKERVIKGKKWQGLTLEAYKNGGVANYTGLIQIDGTKTAPERILSPFQTALFESLVKSMETMSKVNIGSMQYYGETPTIQRNNNSSYTIGDVIINVDKIATDDDYETIAEKVKESIVESITKGRAIGGITL